VPRDWREALDPGGLVRSGVGWRSISRVSMASALCYVCWWGLGMMRCSRAILYVPKQASVVLSCVQDNSKLELIVVVVVVVVRESVGNCRVTLKSVCRYPEA
jgi:hypothetical protein